MEEGTFCDMDNKIASNLCFDAKSMCCFDTDARSMRSCVGNIRSGPQDKLLNKRAKIYNNVRTWK